MFDNSLFSISEAGEDFPSSIETESSIYISVIQMDDLNKRQNSNNKWNIKIYKTDLEWNNNLRLEARRTGKGNRFGSKGKPNIHGGENYQNITNNFTYFFHGKGEITDIPVNLKMSGFSTVLGAQTYETSVIFTVYDEW